MNPGDVIALVDKLDGLEIVYLLLERRPNGVRATRWECLVLHREDDRWPEGRPGHLLWPTEYDLLNGEKMT